MHRFTFLLALASLAVAGGRVPVAAQESKTQPVAQLETVTYDVRDLLRKPEVFELGGPPWNAFDENLRRRRDDPATNAARLVQAIVRYVELHPTALSEENITVLSGSRLVVRTTPGKHAEVKSLLDSFGRLGGVWVVARADLYDVDEAFHRKLTLAKFPGREELEEQERKFLEGVPLAGDPLVDALAKQKPVLAGDEVKIDNGFQATLLSRHQAVTCLPGRIQLLRGDKTPQVILTGVSFRAGTHVSADRRFVRMRLTETATEIEQIQRLKQVVDNDGRRAEYNVPLLNTTTRAVEFEVPDGGSILIPVEHRPRELRDKGRRWVLKITPRIYIEEEEKLFRAGKLR